VPNQQDDNKSSDSNNDKCNDDDDDDDEETQNSDDNSLGIVAVGENLIDSETCRTDEIVRVDEYVQLLY